MEAEEKDIFRQTLRELVMQETKTYIRVEVSDARALEYLENLSLVMSAADEVKELVERMGGNMKDCRQFEVIDGVCSFDLRVALPLSHLEEFFAQ